MRKALLAVAVFAVLAASGTAVAHNGPGARLKCRAPDTVDATFGWVKGGDNPIGDADIQALRLSLDSEGRIRCFNFRSGIEGVNVQAVRNLSFAFMEPPPPPPTAVVVTADSPRIEVEFTDPTASIAMLPASTCNDVLERTDGKWGRADFTGQTGSDDCTLTYGGVPYTSNGTESAWTVFAEAHPALVVARGFFVVDDIGNYRVDQIAFGDHMWTRAGYRRVVHCPTEVSC